MGKKKLKSGQTWANVRQTFGIICFLNFEFRGAEKKIWSKIYFFICCITRGGQTKLMGGQTWANFGQTSGMNFTFKIKFGGFNFTEVERALVSLSTLKT